MAYEDFTTWTELDSGSDLTVAANQITLSGADGDDGGFRVSKDYGAGHFGDYTHYIDFQANDAGDAAMTIHKMNNNGVSPYDAAGCTYVECGRFFTTYLIVQCGHDGGANDYGYASAWFGTRLYLKIVRSSGTFTVYIYSDSGRTTLVDTLAPGGTGSTSRYLITAANQVYPGSQSITGYVWNLDIGEAAAASGKPWYAYAQQ